MDDDGNEAQDAAKNGNALPSLPKRKSSAAAKRDGDWPRFEQALADTQSASEVARLRNEYVREIYPTWNRDWQDTADQEFNKRLAEFSQPGSLKQTLQDSLERHPLHDEAATDEQTAKFHECWEWLEDSTTLTELVMRADNAGFREGLKGLTKDQVCAAPGAEGRAHGSPE